MTPNASRCNIVILGNLGFTLVHVNIILIVHIFLRLTLSNTSAVSGVIWDLQLYISYINWHHGVVVRVLLIKHSELGVYQI